MIDKEYLTHNTTVHLKGCDIESINYQLERIEKVREACYAITATLEFIQNNPPFENKESKKGHFQSYALENFTRQDGMITRGLISMIELIADNLGDTGHSIAMSIEHGNIEPKKEPKNSVTLTAP